MSAPVGPARDAYAVQVETRPSRFVNGGADYAAWAARADYWAGRGALVAVDHFAGVGWGVACHALGIREYGVEKAKEAIRSRSANGMRTIYRDVWSGLFHPSLVPPHRLYLASPPCQTFSMAGNGEGRAALIDVLTAIDDRRWTSADRLFELAELLDPRTALVLTPLAHIWAHRPELVALEQVPEVLPVWNAIGAVLRTLGYSVWTGVLSAEQYGVPQTRKRAILMARLDGKVEPPTPTHSRYYSTKPNRLDHGVQKWVSMAEALGWDTDRESETAAHTRRSRAWSGDRRDRPASAPAPTVTGHDGHPRGGFEWLRGNQFSDLGHGKKRQQSRHSDEPAQTITSMARSWRWADAPATTVAGKGEITAREHHSHGEQSKTALALTVQEAATLQTFPSEFIWRGPKTKQFLQIGNAVPPLMAAAILSALIAPPGVRDAWDHVFAEVAG